MPRRFLDTAVLCPQFSQLLLISCGIVSLATIFFTLTYTKSLQQFLYVIASEAKQSHPLQTEIATAVPSLHSERLTMTIYNSAIALNYVLFAPLTFL